MCAEKHLPFTLMELGVHVCVSACVCVNTEAGCFLISAGRLRFSRRVAASIEVFELQVICSALFYQHQIS